MVSDEKRMCGLQPTFCFNCYLMKFTRQANLAVQFVEVGIAILMGAPFLSLDPTIHNSDSATITTKGPNVLLATTAKPAAETTQLSTMMTPPPSLLKLEARLIRNHQTTYALLSMKPQTPVNIPLLSDLLKTHPNQKFVANLTAGLFQGFWVGYQGNSQKPSLGLSKSLTH